MIRNRGLDPTLCSAGWNVIILDTVTGASAAGVRQAGAVMPYAGKIVSAKHYCATLTDADDSLRVDLHKGASSILSATVDPVAADTVVNLAGAAGTTFAADDVIKAVITSGVGDALEGQITLVIRPLMGREAGAL